MSKWKASKHSVYESKLTNLEYLIQVVFKSNSGNYLHAYANGTVNVVSVRKKGIG